MAAMSATSSTPLRRLLALLAIGIVPVLVVLGGQAFGASWADGILQPRDLAVAAGVLLLAALYLRTLARDPFENGKGIAWILLLAPVPALLAMLTLGGPVTNDEYAYVFQAELLASGQLTETLAVSGSGDPSLLDAFRRRQLYEDTERGVRFSKYAPGTSLALTPVVALGLPPLTATLLLGLLDLWLLACLARRLSLGRPTTAALLLATSPFFLLVHTSLQSEVFTTPAVLGLALALLRLRQRQDILLLQDAVLLGTLSGWVFLVRPLTGVLLAMAATLVVLRLPRALPQRLGTLALAAIGGLPFLAFLLWWNHQLTGSYTTNVYELYAQKYGPFNPRALPERVPIDVYGNGNPALGLLRQSARWSVAFGGMLGAVALAFVGAWRLRSKDGGFALSMSFLLPLAYALHWYPGHRAYLGPLYAFETLGLLLLGLLALLQTASSRHRGALLLAMTAAGGVVFALRWPLIEEEAQARSMPQRVMAREAPAGAVVFLPPKRLGSKELAFKYWTPSLPSDLLHPERPLLLRTNGRLTPSRLVEALGLQGRPLFRLVPDPEDQGRGHLEALPAAGSG